MKLWEEGNIDKAELSRTKEERFPSNMKPMNIEKISSKFKKLMEKGYLNCALLLLPNNMSNGKLPLSNYTLQLLHLKHLEQQEAHSVALLQDPMK